MAGNNGWTTMPLGDFVTLQRGHDLPDQRRRPGGIPIVGSFGITGWHDEAKAPGPGVTVGRSGASFGVVSFSPVPYWPLNTALYVKDFHGNDERFVYYLLKTFDFKRYNSGSAQPSLNRNYVHPVLIDVAPLPEQKAIAHILGTLDDKIELNRRMNETLEGMARAIFKSWFVDFDPVRAKMDGRPTPALDPATAKLFPDRFEHVDGELVPKGWTYGRLEDLLLLQRGFDLPTKNRIAGRYPVVSAGGEHGSHNECKVRGPGVVTGRSGVLGKVFYVHKDFWALNTTLWVREFRASSPIHAYFILKTLGLEAFNSGSAVPTLNRNHIHGLPVVVPPKRVVNRFEEVAGPLFASVYSNRSHTIGLTALRDTLLPKLLSGELRVADAEQITRKNTR